ncbi:MAG TPA: allophanate hydrolase [Acidothermaceae bacterium]|jgi:allophanate hydrolase
MADSLHDLDLAKTTDVPTLFKPPENADDGLGSLQLAVLSAAYATGALDPRGVAAAVHARATARLSDNAWIQLRSAAELRDDAAEIQRRWPDPRDRPVLFGIPIAIKDNVDVAGLPTTAGCADFSYLPTTSASLVRRLIDAGALIVGKSNLDQFATGLTGTRSPYGLCVSPFNDSRIAGGSSSGSALAVATGVVSIAIGTDTAGSGRVPAAFTNTVGLKPSRGLVSSRGVVPACRSLDCPSVFALSVGDAWTVLRVIAGDDADDAWTWAFPALPAGIVSPAARGRIGVPLRGQLSVDSGLAAEFAVATAALANAGHTIIDVDIEPFLLAGELMYDGPWVVERLTDLEQFFTEHPDSIHPVIRDVLSAAQQKTSTDVFRGVHKLAELAIRVRSVWSQIDVLMLPTTATWPTISDALTDPHGVNKILGRCTTFCNLLDLAALTVPSALSNDGMPASVTLYGPSGADSLLASVGAEFHASLQLPTGATSHHLVGLAPAVITASPSTAVTTLLAVAGAHRRGHPLHDQLLALGATYSETVWTAAEYRMYALDGAGPRRPGLVRVDTGGEPIEVELFDIPIPALGEFLTEIQPPLGLGTLALADGRSVTGFICEAYVATTGQDITKFGSWPSYLKTT